MGIVSRLKLDHPALGAAGGSALHTQIETIYKKIGDMSNARMFTQENLADAAYVDFDHNFNSAFDDLRFDLYLYNAGTGEMTEVEDLTGWTITATPGFVKTKIRVSNGTGSSKTIALVILQDPIKLDELTDVETTGVEDGQTLVYDQATKLFKPGASGDSSFKFQKLTSGGVLTVKKGFLILSDGVELRLAADIDITLGIGIDGNHYGYIDRNGLAAATVVAGRKIIDIVAGDFEFSSNAPDVMDRFRYIPIGLAVRSGGVWTLFATLATRAHSLAAGLVAAFTASTLTATQGKQYTIDTNSGDVTLNIPDGKVGLLDSFGFKDGRDFSVAGKNLILKPASDAYIYIPQTSEYVDGSANETLTIDIKGASGFLHYNGSVWVLSLGGYTPVINSMATLTVDDLTVNDEFTPLGGIVGKTAGIPVSAGHIGELIGGLSAGNGGAVYTDTSEIDPQSTWIDALTRNLNKGIYLCCYNFSCFTTTDGSFVADTRFVIGGVIVDKVNARRITLLDPGPDITSINGAIPFVITEDNTPISLQTYISEAPGGNQSGFNEWFIVRLA
jgi:hypothetical protein